MIQLIVLVKTALTQSSLHDQIVVATLEPLGPPRLLIALSPVGKALHLNEAMSHHLALGCGHLIVSVGCSGKCDIERTTVPFDFFFRLSARCVERYRAERPIVAHVVRLLGIFLLWLVENLGVGDCRHIAYEVVEVLEGALGQVEVVELGGVRRRAAVYEGLMLLILMLDIVVQQN